jgi:hypothetical protein
MRDGFFAIAASWHKLAQEAEGLFHASEPTTRNPELDQPDGDDGHSGSPLEGKTLS